MRHNSDRQGSDQVAPGFELHLDGARCEGHGICVLRFPQRITLDEWGYAVTDSRPIDGEHDIARAERAVRACPTGALELSVIRSEPRAIGILGPHVSQAASRN